MPFWIILAIIGGAGLVTGITIPWISNRIKATRQHDPYAQYRKVPRSHSSKREHIIENQKELENERFKQEFLQNHPEYSSLSSKKQLKLARKLNKTKMKELKLRQKLDKYNISAQDLELGEGTTPNPKTKKSLKERIQNLHLVLDKNTPLTATAEQLEKVKSFKTRHGNFTYEDLIAKRGELKTTPLIASDIEKQVIKDAETIIRLDKQNNYESYDPTTLAILLKASQSKSKISKDAQAILDEVLIKNHQKYLLDVSQINKDKETGKVISPALENQKFFWTQTLDNPYNELKLPREKQAICNIVIETEKAAERENLAKGYDRNTAEFEQEEKDKVAELEKFGFSKFEAQEMVQSELEERKIREQEKAKLLKAQEDIEEFDMIENLKNAGYSEKEIQEILDAEKENIDIRAPEIKSPTAELEKTIKDLQNLGYDDEKIKEQLLENEYSKTLINKAFKNINNEKTEDLEIDTPEQLEPEKDTKKPKPIKRKTTNTKNRNQDKIDELANEIGNPGKKTPAQLLEEAQKLEEINRKNPQRKSASRILTDEQTLKR